MSSTPENQFCGHCGDRLPAFGAALGFCPPCTRTFKRVVRPAPGQPRWNQPDSRPMSHGPMDGFAKDPLLATILSAIFPGGGQVYNGHLFKALLVFVTSPLVIPWLIGIADAFFSARRHNLKNLRVAPEPA